MNGAKSLRARAYPSVSVLVPAYNAEATLERTIDSIIAQTRPPLRIVVVDDASTDATPQILSRLQENYPIVVVRNTANLGIARSLNIGASKVNSKYIARLDADDYWAPTHLEDTVELLEEQNLTLVCSLAEYIDTSGSSTKLSQAIDDSTVRRCLLWDNPIVHSSAVYRTDAFQAVKGYSEVERWEDYDLWIRLLSLGKFGCTNRATTIYSVSSNSLSRRSTQLALLARWRCQKSAIKRFWWKYPVRALSIAVVSRIRLSVTSDRRL